MRSEEYAVHSKGETAGSESEKEKASVLLRITPYFVLRTVFFQFQVVEQDFQPGTVIALDEDKGQVAEQKVDQVHDDPADTMPEIYQPQSGDVEQVVNHFRGAGLTDHGAYGLCGEADIQFFLGHPASEVFADVRDPGLPVFDIQLFIDSSAQFPGVFAEQEAFRIRIVFGDDPPDRIGGNSEKSHVKNAVDESHVLIIMDKNEMTIKKLTNACNLKEKEAFHPFFLLYCLMTSILIAVVPDHAHSGVGCLDQNGRLFRNYSGRRR